MCVCVCVRRGAHSVSLSKINVRGPLLSLSGCQAQVSPPCAQMAEAGANRCGMG